MLEALSLADAQQAFLARRTLRLGCGERNDRDGYRRESNSSLHTGVIVLDGER
jgi:hypothetical protein